MKHEARPDWRHALLVASALVILAASHQAHGECVSPSAQAGATSTTVYRCPDADPEQAKQPALGTTEKTTVVERGSANLPWFEPKTTGNKGDADKLPAAKIIEPASAPGKPVETANKPVETVTVPKKVEPGSAPDKPVETVNKGIGLGYTNRRMLPAPVPVFLVYQTAFVGAGGAIEFRPDVYNRDAEIWQHLHPSRQAPVAERVSAGQRRG